MTDTSVSSCVWINRSMENQTMNNALNTTADPNAQIVGSDGGHQPKPNPNAQFVVSDWGKRRLDMYLRGSARGTHCRWTV